MISRIEPTQFVRRLGNGKTRPAILALEEAENFIECVGKLSAGCEREETSLAMEVLSSLLAGDLEIPIPQPYIVEITPDFISSIPDSEWAALARVSSCVAFGSKLLPAGYGAWVAGTTPIGKMNEVAANVLLFDAVTENPDRRAENPNCLVRGDEIRVFDHELAFPPLIIGAPRPWVLGALNFMEQRGRHIFRDALKGRDVNWSPIIARWKGLSNGQLDDYEAVLPGEWAASRGFYRDAIDKIKTVRDNIEGCVAEVRRVLI